MLRSLALLTALPLGAASVPERIVSAVEQHEPARQLAWGLHVINPQTGEVLFAHNHDHWFLPASNMKLLTAALALERLGPDHRFRTRVVAGGELTPGGVLQGDLVMIGGGDVTMSARPIPYVYSKDPPPGDRLAPLRQLAGQVKASGVRRVRGDIVGDDTAYVWEPHPEGWAQADTVWQYGAPVSALVLHDNFFSVRVSAGANGGEPVRASVEPPLPYLLLHTRARTAASGNNGAELNAERAPGSRLVEISGEVRPNQSKTLELAVDDPAQYAAFALRRLLEELGITVDGGTRPRHRFAGDTLAPEPTTPALAERTSPPLSETLKIISKVSQNLHSEVVLREVARASGREPSRTGGLEMMREFLVELGIPDRAVRVEDGSGLSRLALLSPSAITTLLRHMYQSPHRETWLDLWPVGGQDGTLSNRFRGISGGQVLAKTGTLSNTGNLSGYVRTRAGETLCFSMMVNNANMKSSEITDFIDKIVVALLE